MFAGRFCNKQPNFGRKNNKNPTPPLIRFYEFFRSPPFIKTPSSIRDLRVFTDSVLDWETYLRL